MHTIRIKISPKSRVYILSIRMKMSVQVLVENRPKIRVYTISLKTIVYLTIIPRARVGYEVMDSQRGA